MDFQVKNKARFPLVITLNSGRTIHLAPKEVSESMDEIEIKRNQQLERMKEKSLIIIEEIKKKRGETEEGKKIKREMVEGKKLKWDVQEGKKTQEEEEKKQKSER